MAPLFRPGQGAVLIFRSIASPPRRLALTLVDTVRRPTPSHTGGHGDAPGTARRCHGLPVHERGPKPPSKAPSSSTKAASAARARRTATCTPAPNAHSCDASSLRFASASNAASSLHVSSSKASAPLQMGHALAEASPWRPASSRRAPLSNRTWPVDRRASPAAGPSARRARWPGRRPRDSTTVRIV